MTSKEYRGDARWTAAGQNQINETCQSRDYPRASLLAKYTMSLRCRGRKLSVPPADPAGNGRTAFLTSSSFTVKLEAFVKRPLKRHLA